jgi:multidrug efflux pump subunit AcrA (membrane-fusion protein)
MIGRVVGDPEVTISSQSVGVLKSVGPRIGESIAIGSSLASLDAQTNTTNISLSNAQTALSNAKSAANSTLVSLSADLESAKIQHENAVSSKKSVYETTALQIELASLTSQNNTAQAKTLLEQAELSLANFTTTKKDALSSLDDRSSTLAKTIDANLLQVVSSLEPAIESADKILGTTEKNKNANDTYEPYL